MASASWIIERLGGLQAVADMTGLTVNAVQRWTYTVEQGEARGTRTRGLGNRVPVKHWAALLAKSNGKIIIDDLMPDEVAEAVSASNRPKRRKAA